MCSMKTEHRPRLTRRSLLHAAIGAGAGFAGASLVGATWQQNDGQRSITALGAGQAFSVLIRSRGARVLLLEGSNAAAFGNAFSRARYPLFDRIDLVLVPSAPRSMSVVRNALRQMDPRRVCSLGDGTALLDAGTRVHDTIQDSRLIDLPGSTSLLVEISKETPGNPDSSDRWSVSVLWSGRHILVDDGERTERIPSTLHFPDAWLRLSRPIDHADLETVRPGAILVPAGTMTIDSLRQLATNAGNGRFYVYRVHSEETLRIELTDRGSSLPGDPAIGS
jgi:hypothetical protein